MMSKDWWEVGLDRHQIQPLLWPSANCEALGKALLSEPWRLDLAMDKDTDAMNEIAPVACFLSPRFRKLGVSECPRVARDKGLLS